MSTYYHVAPATYSEGETLYSFVELWNKTGEMPEYKWEEMDQEFYTDSMDAQVVCMFETIDEARSFRSDFLPTGKILEINLPEWAHEEGVHLDRVDEGFPCVYHRIPAKLAGETIIRIID
jgi:hypothetical protein